MTIKKELKKKNNSLNQTDNVWWRPEKYSPEELEKALEEFVNRIKR